MSASIHGARRAQPSTTTKHEYPDVQVQPVVAKLTTLLLLFSKGTVTRTGLLLLHPGPPVEHLRAWVCAHCLSRTQQCLIRNCGQRHTGVITGEGLRHEFTIYDCMWLHGNMGMRVHVSTNTCLHTAANPRSPYTHTLSPGNACVCAIPLCSWCGSRLKAGGPGGLMQATQAKRPEQPAVGA